MKSHVSDLVDLAASIYIDASAGCIATNPDERDLKTIRSRVEEEGLSFLTITLPAFCVDFERSLANGRIDPTFFRSFRKNGAIPAFLQGMLGQIFDKGTGGMYEQNSVSNYDTPSIVGSVRQICRAFTKLGIDCSPERTAAAIENFIQTERFLTEATVQAEDLDYFVEVSNMLWREAFVDFDLHSILPNHGPGATADGVSGNQKFRWLSWHERLEPYFPFLETAYSLSSYDSKEFKDVEFVHSDNELPVKVTCVPKTQKGPRIIAIEPCCMQYAQQGLRRYLYERLENFRLTRGHINFRDQSINQRLAMKASEDGLMATLDLSDASDRVLLSLAARMFDSVPLLWDAIFACRSSRAKLPDGRVIGPLAKFASMGSALCFPVESMYFYTICVGALLKKYNLPVTDRAVHHVARFVYVYGDDIIVPSKLAITVCEALEKYHCKVNVRKSFYSGKFRESCGMDAYDGENVTPTYIRSIQPTNRRQVSNLISWIRTATFFHKKGYWRTSSHMYSVCERYLGSLPYVSETSSGLGRTSFLQRRSVGRWNAKLQRFEVKALVAVPVYRTDKLDGYGALQKSMLALNRRFYDDPESADDHLERSARYGTVALKSRWIPVY